MLILFIDLWGLLNLVGSFIVRIFHNVIYSASIALVRAYTFSRWLTALSSVSLLIPERRTHIFNTWVCQSLQIQQNCQAISLLLGILMMTTNRKLTWQLIICKVNNNHGIWKGEGRKGVVSWLLEVRHIFETHVYCSPSVINFRHWGWFHLFTVWFNMFSGNEWR